MVNVLALALAVSVVHAVPVHLTKRIAQVIDAATAKWEQACLAAGGGEQCNPVSVAAFSTLLAAAGNCDQQNAADNMIDLAKTLNNDPTMISLTQVFVQQPRNSPNSVAVPYCTSPPKNPELNGLFQCQFQSSNQKVFVGNLQLGQPGTIPFGKSAPLNPLGSCPAHTSGPIADGSQLVDITTNPGVGSSSSSSSSSTTNNNNNSNSGSKSSTSAASTATTTASSSLSSSSSSSGDFHLANAQEAQQLNSKFATLTADSTCTDGDEACIGTSFAQCVSGKFVTTPCSTSTICVALPLVNKPGTSIACDTESDAIARIQAAGGSASLTGDGSSAPSSDTGVNNSDNTSSSDNASTSSQLSSSSSSSSGGGFQLANAQEAQELNAKFATLTADSACTDGDEACIGTSFAQCISGKFMITPCSTGTICAALPLVNKPGASIACDTEADAIARIQAAGGTPSLTGQ